MKYDKEIFIKKANEVHKGKYDYSKTEYQSSTTKVCIICLEHGEFWQTPVKHLSGQGCPKCSGHYEHTTEEFIERSERVHGKKYGYEKTVYLKNNQKVCIICPEHGEFWQTPHNHLYGSGCPKCGIERRAKDRRLTLETFLERCEKTHKVKYDYSKVVFRGLDYNIRIVCPTHGEFKQLAEVHIGGGNCPKCAGQYSPTTEEWKERAALIHHGKYRYDKVIFTRGHNKVIITCPIHGDFMQEAKRHLEGYGCSKCSGCKVDQEDFIKNARKVHGEDYIYDNVNYKNNHTKVCIICPEHGEFWQKPNVHLNGHGCPICKKSHLERSVETMLRDNNIPYEGNYRNKEIFGQQSLDFYLPHINIAIECQGEQHYVKNYYKKFGEETCTKRLEYVKALDVRKNKLCAENGIELIYYQEKKLNKYFSFNNLCFNTLDEIKEYILAKYKK